ncbi:hypothetical protein O181_043718 [Austropuccinia psidii MF-1]|uniref:Integrase catalytic domain-containing protein n=1 Tax=Austropuccinia psidii MF-1 TaxID=1389203 RepID=A0A9Q3DLY3_9BASI|nr:hypothetical protein [Austropuccinia psidii MF-1]
MIHIQEPNSPGEVLHMDCVTAFPPSGGKSYTACLVSVDRYRKTPIFLPCHKDDTSINTAVLLYSRVISRTGLVRNIINDRDPNFTSALWTNIYRLVGTKLSFSTAYHCKIDGLAEMMIQTLQHIIRRFCDYGLGFKDSDGFTHDWCTLTPALKLTYKTSVHSSIGQTPAMLEKGWYPRLPADTLRKDLIDIHPTDFSFKKKLDKLKLHAKRSLKKIKDYYVGPFDIVALHGTNAVQVELSGELENKHPTFPVSLINPYQPAEKELFPLRNPTPLTVLPVEQMEDKKRKKIIKERRLRGKIEREYLVRYRIPVHEYEWLAESETPDSDKLFRRFRHERRPQA